MGAIGWEDIRTDTRPMRLSTGTQTLKITAVREYTNTKNHRCVELVFENGQGEQGRQYYSVEPELTGYIDQFLDPLLHMSTSKVIDQGGWQTLVGMEFTADVDYGYEGDYLRLMPVWY